MKRSAPAFSLVVLVLLVAFLSASITSPAAASPAPPPTPRPSGALQLPQPQLGAAPQPASNGVLNQYQPCAGSGSTYTTSVGSEFIWTFYVQSPSSLITGFWVGGNYDSTFLHVTAIEAGNLLNISDFTPSYDNGPYANFEAYGDVVPPTSATSTNNSLVFVHFRAMAPTSGTTLEIPDFTIDFTTGTSACQATNTIVIQAADTAGPTVAWVSPVTSEGQRYDASGGTASLQVSATDSSGISQVRFYRWDAANQQAVEIGTVFSPPYQAGVTIADLNMEWNEIDANVFDTAGNYTHTYFWIYRTQPATNCTTSTGVWQNRGIALQTGTFTAEFDATPSNAAMDGVIGFASSAASAYASLAAVARFSPQGVIDARNGGAYQAAQQIPYSAGGSYHFRLVIRIPSHTYDIFVTPAGAAEQVVGTNFGFRTEQNSVANLGYVVLYAKTGSHTACNLVITPSSAPAPPPASFAAAPTSGPAPLSVQFTDTSSGDPTSWAWDFDNDGTTDSVEQNPSHTYTAAGSYTVKLTVTNAGGSDSLRRDNYIAVSAPPTQDSDGDALPDAWETNGVTLNNIFIDLPSMGADPNKKDVFVQIDWMEDKTHNQKPTPQAIQTIVSSFAHSGVDGKGINLHVDVGADSTDYVTGKKWGSLAKGHAILYAQVLGQASDLSNEVNKLLNDGRPRQSEHVFHYAFFGAQYLDPATQTATSSSGYSFASSQVFIVTLGMWTNGKGSLNEQAGTFMHELGHNLGLFHGGSLAQANVNYKPNYLSVMNYSFQMSGLIKRGTNGNEIDGYFDYSRFNLPDLNEKALTESGGINGGSQVTSYGTKHNIVFPYLCKPGYTFPIGLLPNMFAKDTNVNGPIDWNCSNKGGVDAGIVQADVNGSDTIEESLTSYNDWNNLRFKVDAIGPGAASPRRNVPRVDASSMPGELTLEEDRKIQRIAEPRAQLFEAVTPTTLMPNEAATYVISLINIDPVQVNGVSITATLPPGFIYQQGSTSGVTTADPARSGQNLTWPGPFSLNNGDLLQLSFRATTTNLLGTYFSSVAGQSTNGIVVATGTTAPVTVGYRRFVPLVAK